MVGDGWPFRIWHGGLLNPYRLPTYMQHQCSDLDLVLLAERGNLRGVHLLLRGWRPLDIGQGGIQGRCTSMYSIQKQQEWFRMPTCHTVFYSLGILSCVSSMGGASMETEAIRKG